MDCSGLGFLSILLCCACSASPPNFVLLFADDLGFGDLGCFGHPASLTPNLDRLAAGGLRFTDFYCTSPVCSPSRYQCLHSVLTVDMKDKNIQDSPQQMAKRRLISLSTWLEQDGCHYSEATDYKSILHSEVAYPMPCVEFAQEREGLYGLENFNAGRYQTRSGVYPGVLYPGSRGGLPLNETTIAEVLKPLGYATAAIGKWHLGFGPNGMFLPTKQGFDLYLGIPYSHDMGPCHNLTCFPPDIKCFGMCDVGTVTVPLMHNDVIKQQPVNFLDLERAYSDFATGFITASAKKKQPFFLYYPSHHTHYPQYAGQGAAGHSLRGPFGDSLLEFDNTIGNLLTTLEKTGVINNTLVFFTSDNGPELMRMSRGGNSGPLKCGKGTTYEGGMREPAIAYWPGTIKPGVTHEMASTLDVLPTLASLAGAKLPQVMLDGVDMTELLIKQGKSKRETMMFYPTNPCEKYGLFALRLGKHKAHFYTQGAAHSDTTPDHDCSVLAVLKAHDPPLIFDLEADPSENYPLSVDTPEIQAVLEQIKKVKEQFETSMVFGESQILKGTDPNLEPCCNPECSPKPTCCHC